MSSICSINDLNAFTKHVLSEHVEGLPIAFTPISLLEGIDCGSDVFLKLAEKKAVDPQAVGEALVSLLGTDRFCVTHGFLNFYGGDARDWLLSPEPFVARDTRKQHKPIVLAVHAPDIDGKELHPLWSLRLKAFVLFQSYLLTSICNETVRILGGAEEILVTKETLLGAAKKFLSLKKISITEQQINGLQSSSRVFLHTSPQGLPRPLYQQFVASEKSETPWLKFTALEKVFFNAPVLPWMDTYLEKILSNQEVLLSALYYLSCSYQATELDDSVAFCQENANLFWWLSNVMKRLSTILPAQTPDLNSVTTTKFDPKQREVVLAIKFFPLYLEQAAYEGKLFEFTNVLRAMLKFTERTINHPTMRDHLKKNTLSSELLYILTGVKSRLELFSR